MQTEHGIPVVEEMQVVFVVRCPHCSMVNYVIDGSPYDETKPNIDGLTCRQCKQDSFFETSIKLAACDARINGIPIEEISMIPYDGDLGITVRDDGTLSGVNNSHG